ncbi:MAG: hypothetical protein ACRET7_07355 [Burkholderiales bacterium]
MTKPGLTARLWPALSAVLLIAGCATEVQKFPSPTPHAAPEVRLRSVVLVRNVEVELPTSYKRLLKQGSTWTYVGNIPQGEVFRPDSDVLTVEGSHVHEAYLVISASRLVGFYLPVEKAFSPLHNQPHILFTQ